MAWLVLSGVHPLKPEKWGKIKYEMVKNYYLFVNDFGIVDFHEKIFPNSTNDINFGETIDNDLMGLIHGDIIRTSHHIPFFSNPDRSISESDSDILIPYHEHMRRIERILYIFAKLNCSLSYLQGFNELICPIFFVFMQSFEYFSNSFDIVEALSFYVFQKLMSTTNLHELFTTQDKSSIIMRRMDQYMSLLHHHFPNLHFVIHSFDIHPLVFAYPWMNLMFAQEYYMPNIVLVWDSILTHFDNLVEYISYIAVATIKLLENDIDPHDYIKTMTTLKKYRIDDIRSLLKLSNQLWKKDMTDDNYGFFHFVYHKIEQFTKTKIQ